MASRREFLQLGIAASVFPGLVAGGQAARLMSPSTTFYKVIFDQRYSGGRAFARRAEQLGAIVQPIEGDITSLWYNDLSERLKKSPVALAGVTLNGALFCLDALARAYGMRVVFRTEHNGGGHALNWDEQSWGDEVAELLTRVAERARDATPPAVIVPHLTRPERNTESLVSWVIVPAGARMIS